MAKIEAPAEVQNQISEKLKESGFLDSLNKKVLEALNQAARAISTKSELPKSLITQPRSIMDTKNEAIALQAIYQYLKANGLNYTLSTLQSETTINIDNRSPQINILEVFKSQAEEEYSGIEDDFNLDSDPGPSIEKPVEKPVEKPPPSPKVESVAPISLQDEFGSDSSESNQDIPIEDSEGSDIPIEDSDDFNISDEEEKPQPQKEVKVEQPPTGTTTVYSHHEVEPPVPISKFDFERIPLRFSVNQL